LPRNRHRLVTLLGLAVLAVLLLPGAALGWANGVDGPNGFGTHDWILQEAARLAARDGAGWVDLSTALPHTDDPDTEFHDFYNHVYDTTGGRVYGGAPAKVALYYAKALAARKAGKPALASKYAGIMAHYYGDICCPLHTDQTDAEEGMHSAYESDVDEYTTYPGEHRAWVSNDGYKARSSVGSFTRATATASRSSYSALVRDYNRDRMSSAVVAITAASLDRAANGLADLLVMLKKGLRAGTPSVSIGGGGGSGGGGSGGGGSGTTVYITKSGTKYHRAGCRYLSSSRIPISLGEAKARGYEPCSVCDPPR
jgi:hypothetical protein